MALNWKKLRGLRRCRKAKEWQTEYMHNVMNEHTHTARSEKVTTVKMMTAADATAALDHPPTPSRHGVDVDPTGEFIVAGGKLATSALVHAFSKMQKAIADQAFDGEREGIPVFKYEAVNFCEVQNPGLGPLQLQFDGTGNAYTSVFISSEIVKYTLPGCEVVGRIPTYYSIGHLMIPGGDTKKPYGKYEPSRSTRSRRTGTCRRAPSSRSRGS